jgi:branched-chain amino acid transport system permease protein
MSMYYVVLTLSFSLVIGHLGLFSLCQPVFLGIGAYSTAILGKNFGISNLLISLPTAGIAAAIFGLLVALLTLKLSRYSFAMVTLAITFIIKILWTLDPIEVTNGALGIKGIPNTIVVFSPLVVDNIVSHYYIILVLMLVTTAFYFLLMESRVGMAFKAVRENQPLAQSFAININKYKIINLVFSAFFTGLAGNFYANYLTIVGV